MVAILASFTVGTHSLQALEGRTLGSVLHTASPIDEDALRWLYELGGYQTITNNLNLRLRMSIDYYSRFGLTDDEIWKSRFYGELRAPTWRVEGQFAPWQRNAIAALDSRQRDGTLRVLLAPRGLPHLDAQYQRLERRVRGLHSQSEDRYLRLSYGARGMSGQVGYRQVDASGGTGISTASRTQEWRSNLQGARSWRRGSLLAAYEGLLSRYSQRERQSDLSSHRVLVNGAATPVRKVTVGVSAQQRWGRVTDNSFVPRRDIDESAISGRLEFRPIADLRLSMSRDYRRQQAQPLDIVSDYLQLEAIFRRDITRGLAFQTGYLRVANFVGSGTAPNNSAYALVEGRLRRGVETRLELRGSSASGSGLSGVRWTDIAELRTRPGRASRFEVSYRRDAQPKFFGVPQTDHEWQLLGGYEPFRRSNLLLVWRRLDGSGRVDRAERLWTLTAGYGFMDRSRLSVNWSRRDIYRPYRQKASAVLGLDVTTWLPGDWRVRGLYRRTSSPSPYDYRSYGLSLEKRF